MHYTLASMAVTIEKTDTPQSLSKINCRVGELLIKSKDTNAGNLYIGGKDVDKDKGFPLSPGESLALGGIRGSAEGGQFDLLYSFVSGTAGDSVVVLLNKAMEAGQV